MAVQVDFRRVARHSRTAVWHYDPEARLSALAAAYGFGLAKNHPYVDGNKRMALVALAAFLARNGSQLTATNVEAVEAMLAVASGEWSEEQLAEWVEEHMAAG